jgi:ketosteroid isomerase-like protein
MYHAIVEKRVRTLFDAVNRGDAEPVLCSFSQRFEHLFLGENHALSGSRHTLALTRAWYERLYRLLPDIEFEVFRVWVSGARGTPPSSLNGKRLTQGLTGCAPRTAEFISCASGGAASLS